MQKSDGLGFLFRDIISKHAKFVDTESEYKSWLKICKSFQHQADDIIIGTVFIPPLKSNFFSNAEMEVFEQEITSVCSSFELVYTQIGDLEDYTSTDTYFSDFFHFDDATIDFYDQKCALERYTDQSRL